MYRIGIMGSSKPLETDYDILRELGVDDCELCLVPRGSDGLPEPGTLDGVDALSIEWGRADSDVIAAHPGLRAITVMSVGFDNVDVPTATAAGIWVCNVPGYCTYDVALHTLGLIVDLYKKITWFDDKVRAGVWDDMIGYEPPRPRGQRAGLVFFGSIPQTLAPMLQAIGMEVAAWAPTKSAEFLAGFGVEKVETPEELFATSDVVSLHCPLVPATQDLVRRETLALMKPTAFLVQTARGGCVVEEDLAQALLSGTIRAAAVDVIRDEVHGRSPLIGLENCVVTPHCAYHSADSFHEMRLRAIKGAVDALHGLRPEDPVNEVA